MRPSKYKFYDPHPGGVVGCPTPLPVPIKRAIDYLTGEKPMTMHAAVVLLLRAVAVASKAGSFSDDTKVEIVDSNRCILMHATDAVRHTQNCWRLLRFREVRP